MQAKTVENVILSKERAIKSEFTEINKQMLEKHRQLLALKDEQANVYKAMAKIFLLESPQVDSIQQVQDLLADLHNEFSLLEQRLQDLEKLIAERQVNEEQLLQQINKQTVEKANILNADANFIALISKLELAQEQYQKIAELHQQAVEEFGGKLKKYSTDRRYNYLIKRKFTEPEYKGFWIFRNLDHWLARQVNFTANYKNQKILEALLAESNNRYETSKNTLQALIDEKTKYEARVELTLAIPTTNKQLEEVRKQLTSYQDTKERLYQELKDNKSGEGSKFIEVTKKLAIIMQQMSTSTLTDFTVKTESTEDDKLLNKIIVLNKRVEEEQEQLVLLELNNNSLEAVYKNFKQLTSSFLNKNMGEGNYKYAVSSRELNDLLVAVINNQNSTETTLKKLLKIRSEDITSSYITNSLFGQSKSSSWSSSNSSSSLGSTGSRSSKGFSSSSSSGGGGFRTTDSF